MKILVTGGAGYIGSHTLVALLAAGYSAVVIDNFVNSHPEALRRVEQITGRTILACKVDLADPTGVERIFSDHKFDAVIHLAGLKAVGESGQEPLRYYRNNLGSTLTLLEAMARHGCHRLVFSSSATVYGVPDTLPINEDAPLRATNPYGRTKLFIEEILRDLGAADARWKMVLLRYFNPVGAHPSGLIGEDPQGIPNNLFPRVVQVAAGRRPELEVYGGDYPTPDGTAMRDYLHVCDLAEGHVRAVEKIETLSAAVPINLGTGRGCSVMEIIRAFSATNDCAVPYRIVARRPGDVPVCYADPARAKALLGWEARRDLIAMCADAWHWQKSKPG
jgi:UDP-glucose 4-epimerase